MEIKLKLHDNVLIIGEGSKDRMNLKSDIVLYLADKNLEPLLETKTTLNELKLAGQIFEIGLMEKLYNHSFSKYIRLREKHWETFEAYSKDPVISAIVPIIIITYLILKQIKYNLDLIGGGDISVEITKNELNVAWDLFKYIANGLPAINRNIDKISEDEFKRIYATISLLK